MHRCIRAAGSVRVTSVRSLLVTTLLSLSLASQAWAQGGGPLPDIPRGDIAIQLTPVATGMGAPLYGISPPGDTNRMFVLE